MYGASLTKTAFAHMLLQLVDEGRLSLDASVDELLPRPLPEYDDFKDLASDAPGLVQGRPQRLDRKHGYRLRERKTLSGHDSQ